jgi:perosamine synthetase
MIPIARPWVGEAEIEAVKRPLLSGWMTQGPEVAAFEQEFAAYTGAAHACAVSNCTTGLFLALRAVGVGEGDEVVTVSHSFIATANAVRHLGAVPVFVDIDPATYCMDPALVEAAITPKTKAILCVHQIGMPCDLERLVRIAQAHNLPLIEDAACAIGSEVLFEGRWEKVGKAHGLITCFSFHPRKILTTGDGGMLTTHDPALDRQFRLGRHHGMAIPDTTRHAAKNVVTTTYAEVGYNFRLTDIQAAVGRAQLARMPEVVVRRRALADRYRAAFEGLEGVTTPHEPAWARTNWQSYCVRLDERLDQRAIMERLRAGGVASLPGVMCAHLEDAYVHEPWRTHLGEHRRDALPESERAYRQGLILPLYHDLRDDEQDQVIEALRAAVLVG